MPPPAPLPEAGRGEPLQASGFRLQTSFFRVFRVFRGSPPINPMQPNSPSLSRLSLLFLGVGLVLGWIASNYWRTPEEKPTPKDPAETLPIQAESDSVPRIHFPESQWEKGGIAFHTVSKKPFSESIQLTGKVSLNEDRIAHIYPMVEGAVDRVSVGLGQVVQANDLLVVIHSREVGAAKLELYQARLSLEMATVKNDIQVEISKNAEELLDALRERKPIQDIEEQFRSRGMGDYRERLLLAYANYIKSHTDVDRLESVTDSGAIAAKQLIAARTARDADLATFQARLEQIEYELKTSLLLSSQSVREASTRVSVAATNLRILGCEEGDIEQIDPELQKESISDYPLRAPFEGTILSKDVALKEQVRPDTQIMSIADLSHVWITADVYERNVPLLNSLSGKTLTVRNEAWPDRTFEAQVFYTGEIMDDKTRTIAMRAIAENREQLLKPGMFVTIELPGLLEESVLQIPKSALLEHQGIQFVFIHREGDVFERREVTPARIAGEWVVIESGLQVGEEVVVSGGFILKSKLLADLMGE